MKFTLTQFFKSQFTTLPESSTFLPDLTGRVVIVTGSNVGLGFECAKALSHRNPSRLILAVRNVEAGEAAAREIVKANPPGAGVKTIPEVWKLDLGDLASVKAFGERAEKELDRLDIVVSTTSFDFELIFGCSKRNFELSRLDMNASQFRSRTRGSARTSSSLPSMTSNRRKPFTILSS
jgi:NAD(P)-dependent dehydrogenase (short-subunit alcohol dehydrogenase family)